MYQLNSRLGPENLCSFDFLGPNAYWWKDSNSACGRWRKAPDKLPH